MVYVLDMSKEEYHPEYLSTGEAARILGVHPVAVWQMVRAKRIPAMQVGRNWIIPKGELLEFAKTYVKGPGRRKPRPEGETS